MYLRNLYSYKDEFIINFLKWFWCCKMILLLSILQTTVQLDELFDGNVVVAIVTAPASEQNNHLKLGRQLKQTNETKQVKKLFSF